jgi:hypothetical protein
MFLSFGKFRYCFHEIMPTFQYCEDTKIFFHLSDHLAIFTVICENTKVTSYYMRKFVNLFRSVEKVKVSHKHDVIY